eukprot:33485-Pleurochrysis_carterae.AAC.2
MRKPQFRRSCAGARADGHRRRRDRLDADGLDARARRAMRRSASVFAHAGQVASDSHHPTMSIVSFACGAHSAAPSARWSVASTS